MKKGGFIVYNKKNKRAKEQEKIINNKGVSLSIYVFMKLENGKTTTWIKSVHSSNSGVQLPYQSVTYIIN